MTKERTKLGKGNEMTNKDQQIIEEQRAIQRLRQWSGMRYGKDSNDVHYDTRHLLCAHDRLYEEHKRYREVLEWYVNESNGQLAHQALGGEDD